MGVHIPETKDLVIQSSTIAASLTVLANVPTVSRLLHSGITP